MMLCLSTRCLFVAALLATSKGTFPDHADDPDIVDKEEAGETDEPLEGDGDGAADGDDGPIDPEEEELEWREVQIDKMKGDVCRTTCDTAAGYATGACAGMASFAAPMACLPQALTAVACAAAQGILWGIGSYCTSSAVFRTCELCGPSMTLTDLLDTQLRLHGRLEDVGEIFVGIARARYELEGWALQWSRLGEELDFKLRSEMHFEDVDHMLHLMSQIEFDKDLPGVPINNFALSFFNKTAMSPGKNGVLNLINQMHRLMAGGGITRHFGSQKSIFELDATFCKPVHVGALEMNLLTLYQAFFFAGKLNGFDDDDVAMFQNGFIKSRQKQRDHFVEVCKVAE